MPVDGRTVRKFQSSRNVWEIADEWAKRTGYRIVEEDRDSRLYQRGPGLRYQGAAQMVHVEAVHNGFVLQAWISIHISRISRFLSAGWFNRVPNEMPIDSGGPAAVVTSSRARDDVNKLLYGLGVKPLII